MRSLLLLCVLATCLILVCNRSKRHEEQPRVPAPVASTAPLRSESAFVTEVVSPAPKPGLLSLLTLGAAVLGAVSAMDAESPLDANAQLAVHVVDTTAQLEASAARVADQRAR